MECISVINDHDSAVTAEPAREPNDAYADTSNGCTRGCGEVDATVKGCCMEFRIDDAAEAPQDICLDRSHQEPSSGRKARSSQALVGFGRARA